MSPPRAKVRGALSQWANVPAKMLPKGVNPPKARVYTLITLPRRRPDRSPARH